MEFFIKPLRTRGKTVRLALEALREIQWRLHKMTDQVAEINSIIDGIAGKVSTVSADVSALLASVAAANSGSQPVDLTDVETRLTGIAGSLGAIDAAVNPPAPAPAPAQTDVTATADTATGATDAAASTEVVAPTDAAPATDATPADGTAV
jgi:hypothetical protein